MPRFNKEYLQQIIIEKLIKNSIPRLNAIGYFDTTKPRRSGEILSDKNAIFQKAITKSLSALIKSDEASDKIIKMHPKQVLRYIQEAIQTGSKDTNRKEKKHIKAEVTDTGKLPMGYEYIEKGKCYKKKHLEELEERQKERDYPTVKWQMRSLGEVIEMPANIIDDETGDEYEGIEYIQVSEAKEDFEDKEEKRDNKEFLINVINKLSSKCRNLINEYRRRDKKKIRSKIRKQNNKEKEDPFFKRWADDINVNYDTLKGRYKRCVDALEAKYKEEEAAIA